jgi:hypothetical protein
MNRDIKILISLFFTSAFLMAAGTIIKFQGGHFPLSALNWLLIGFITAWVAFRLFSSNKKDSQLVTFNLFFLFFSLFISIMAFAHFPLFLPHSRNNHELFSQIMHLGYATGHIFLYLSLAVFVRLPLNWASPRLKNIGSAFFLLLGIVTTVLNFLMPSMPEFSHATGVTLLNVAPLVGKLVALNVVLAWVPSAIYFIVKGARSREKIIRRRAMLLGIGLLIATVVGPLHDISQQAMMFFIADVVVLAGIVILASGVMYKETRA